MNRETVEAIAAGCILVIAMLYQAISGIKHRRIGILLGFKAHYLEGWPAVMYGIIAAGLAGYFVYQVILLIGHPHQPPTVDGIMRQLRSLQQ